ncbi:hypothetical protein [Dactylosporangium salmoneum]|uniref:Prepilin-type N-terminal cleavage/methylation domain-containing protein n=1 Tax=Dactylosporangium salmoneum TaxID=53361 RepID=A0ABP5S8N7_9ACTN
MSLAERFRDATRRGDDRGVTLAELAVTTGIMSVVMAIFTTGLVQLFKAGNANEMVALTQAQLNTAFLRLDRELRYSAGFGPLRTDASGNTFVEYLNPGTAGGTPACVQLELYKDGKTLRRQAWPSQGSKPTGRWSVLASQVNVPKSSMSFPASDNTTYQRLRIQLYVASNPGSGQTEAFTDLTFTALNSRPDTAPSSICPEART